VPVSPAPALPSATSALALVNGEAGAFPKVAAHLLGRAALIYAGLYMSGRRQGLTRISLVASAAIEAFVLGWAASQSKAAP